ncbi:MAG: hypothetical protein ABIB47_02735 [Candidatus Woesearchaeota archaeon]
MFKRSVGFFHKIRRELVGGVALFVGSIIAFVLASGISYTLKWPFLALGLFKDINKKFLGNKRCIWKRKMRRV